MWKRVKINAIVKEHKNAIEYIKDSSLYREERYGWLKQLIDGVLIDSINGKDIKSVINKKCSIEEYDETEVSFIKSEETDAVEIKPIGVSKIQSIESVSNIGLLEITEPIPLTDGLNIFYGKNAGGKSSIFLALCKVFGINKKVYSNINLENENSVCTVKIVNNERDEQSITWVTDEVNKIMDIKVFDSQLSNYLVENDQVNQFEIAKLKSEYFSFLHAEFDKVADDLDRRHVVVKNKKDQLQTKIEMALPKFFEEEKELSNEEFCALVLSEKEKQRVIEAEGQLKILGLTNTKAVVKNIEGVLGELTLVLKLFEDEKEGEIITERKLKYTKEFLDNVSEGIRVYNKATQAFGLSKEKLTKLVPRDWINKDLWDKFIESGLDFIQTLEGYEKEKYSVENCAFCQQPLETPQAKELIKTYQEILSEHQVKLKEAEDRFNRNAVIVEKTIAGINNIPRWNKLIEAEFTSIGKMGVIGVNVEMLISIFREIKNGIDKREEFKVSNEQIEIINKTWELYKDLLTKFHETITSLNEALIDKETKIENLTKEVNPLKYRGVLLKFEDEILNYFKTNKLLAKIIDCQTDVTAIRKSTSRLETTFAKEETLKLFENHLQNEYRNFDFTPPPVWNISVSTRGGENKRIYSLGDKRLSDIFSEGERKIHALADFFAQAEMNNFRGVYMFDDPVNSLDEERIEYVSNRILQLVEDGNQVIVFTHNLVFLNLLVDTEKAPINRISRLATQIMVQPNLKMDKELKERYDVMKKRIDILNNKDENEISEYELRNIYDLMSGYIETYVEVKLLKNVINRYRPNIRMHSLDRLKHFDVDIIDDILNIYKQTSRKGSRHSQPLCTPAPKYFDLKMHFQEVSEKYKY